MANCIISFNNQTKQAFSKGQDPLKILKAVIQKHSSWNIVDETTGDDGWGNTVTNKLVVKNLTGLLNYDPYIIFMIENKNIYMSPCKSYDSSKSWDEQEGAINNAGKTYRFNVDYADSSNGAIIEAYYITLISGIIITNYSINLYLNRYYCYNNNYYYYYKYDKELIFTILDALDKDNSGMYCKSNDYSYLYADGIWYGQDWDSLWNKIFKIDVDKSVGFRHKPSPTGSIMASPYTFFINTQDDQNTTPTWKYIGLTKDVYSYINIIGNNGYAYNEHYSTIKGVQTNLIIEGERKICRILGKSQLVFPDSEIQEIIVKEWEL